MSSQALVLYEVLPPAGADGDGDAGGGGPLRRLRQQVQPYPPSPGGDPRARALLYGALGSGASLVGAGVAAALPDPAGVRASDFYVLGKDAVASLIELLGSLVAPLAILGLLLLLATAVIYLVKTEEPWVDALCVAQPVVGLAALGGAGVGWLALVALLALNVVIWIVVIAIIGAIVIGALSVLAGLK